eukprot:7276903-Prymnesium_polylepis.1
MLFAEQEAGYLAGYMAGLATHSGVIGAVLGPEIAPVLRFANGFANGAQDACALVAKRCVTIHKCERICHQPERFLCNIPSFTDGERGFRLGMLLGDRGADVVFEAGGYTGTCGIAGASVHPGVRAVVGVDVDRFNVAGSSCHLGPINTSKIITSAQKR